MIERDAFIKLKRRFLRLVRLERYPYSPEIETRVARLEPLLAHIVHNQGGLPYVR